MPDDQKTVDEINLDMETGKTEEDVYSEEGREKLIEGDEISPEEEGFMEGAEGLGQKGKCQKCGKSLVEENTIETEIGGELKWFCSDQCSEKYIQSHSN